MEKKKCIQIALLVLVLAIAIFGSYVIFAGGKAYIKIEDDYDKLSNAIITSSLLKSYESNQELTYQIINMKDIETINENDPTTDDIKNLINGFRLKANTIKTLDNKNNMFLDIMLDNKTFAKIDIYYDNDIIVFDLSDIYSKKFYLKYEDINKVLKRINPQITEEINIKDYTSLFAPENLGTLKNIDLLSYYKTIKEKTKDGFVNNGKADIKIMENGKEKKFLCNDYELTLGQKQMLEVTGELINKLAADENVKTFIKDKSNEIMDLLIKTGDYKLINITAEDMSKKKEEFNKNYDTIYEQELKSIDEEFKKALTDANATTNVENKIKYNFAVDRKYNIRKINTEQTTTTEGISFKTLMTTTMMNQNKNIKLATPDIKEALNLAEISDEQYKSIGTSISMNLLGKSMQSPSIQKVIVPYISAAQSAGTSADTTLQVPEEQQ